MRWDLWLVLVVLGIIVPWRGSVRVRKLLSQPDLSSLERISVYASTIAFQWLAAVIVFWRAMVRCISLTSLALAIPNRARTILISIGFAALLTGYQLLGIRRMASLPREKQGFNGELVRKLMPRNSVELLAFMALVATVALCEEFLYRGFVQSIFGFQIWRSATAGVIVSAAFFSAAHLYQGRRGLLVTFLAGILFAVVRQLTGSLLPTMLAHFAADFVAGALGWRLISGAGARLASGSTDGAVDL